MSTIVFLCVDRNMRYPQLEVKINLGNFSESITVPEAHGNDAGKDKSLQYSPGATAPSLLETPPTNQDSSLSLQLGLPNIHPPK